MSAEELLQYQSNVGTAILLTLIGIATLFVIVSAIIVWAIGACHYAPKKKNKEKRNGQK